MLPSHEERKQINGWDAGRVDDGHHYTVALFITPEHAEKGVRKQENIIDRLHEIPNNRSFRE